MGWHLVAPVGGDFNVVDASDEYGEDAYYVTWNSDDAVEYGSLEGNRNAKEYADESHDGWMVLHEPNPQIVHE